MLDCNNWSAVVSSRELRDNDFNVRNEDRSLQGAAAWKRNPKGNSKGDAQMKTAISGPRKENVHEESRAASSTMTKREQGKEDPVLSPKREDTRKETEKGDTEGKGHKGTSPSGKSHKPVCTHVPKEQCHKEST